MLRTSTDQLLLHTPHPQSIHNQRPQFNHREPNIYTHNVECAQCIHKQSRYHPSSPTLAGYTRDSAYMYILLSMHKGGWHGEGTHHTHAPTAVFESCGCCFWLSLLASFFSYVNVTFTQLKIRQLSFWAPIS